MVGWQEERLENCLNSIVAGLRAAAEGVKAVRLKRERWERERQEQERRRYRGKNSNRHHHEISRLALAGTHRVVVCNLIELGPKDTKHHIVIVSRPAPPLTAR